MEDRLRRLHNTTPEFGGWGLTLPSRGPTKGYAFCGPLMSNVRRHNNDRLSAERAPVGTSMTDTKPVLTPGDHFRIILELAYLALPLLIYILFFLVVVAEFEWSKLWHKPEWMFIALLYSSENLRDSIDMYGNDRGARTGALQTMLLWSILQLVLTAVVLFAALGAYEGAFSSSRSVSTAQWICFISSLVLCWQQKIFKRIHQLEAKAP
jgi:hypothetical protein